MQVYEIRDSFGLDHLVRTERPDPVPGPGQAAVRMAAVSLNYRDLLMVQGQYNPRQRLPLVPCSDGVGRVLAVGAGVTRVSPGERVAATFFPRWIAGAPSRELLRQTLGGPLDGTLAEVALLDEQGLVHVPEHLSDVEAATLPCSALTAWTALVEEGGLRAGQSVLVQGTGGVSLAALQLARLCSAEVIVTSSSDEKLERARALGADHGVNYRSTPEWGKRAVELTGGRGVDHVLEVGGAGTIEQSIVAVATGGTISLIGNLTGSAQNVSLVRLFMRKIRLQGVLVGHREAFEAMNRAVARSRLRPVVDRVFPFEAARDAFETMASGSHFGKICIQLAP